MKTVRILEINPDVIQAVRTARELARDQATPLNAMKNLTARNLRNEHDIRYDEVPHDYIRPNIQKVIIPDGYRCAFSFEQQPGGLSKHLSISVEDRDPAAMPNPIAFDAIAGLFGFDVDNNYATCVLWIEEYQPGRRAVNIVQLDKDGNDGKNIDGDDLRPSENGQHQR